MQLTIPICNSYLRVAWFAIAATTVVSEVTRVPHMSRLLHYGIYSPGKLVFFLMAGYLTPLAFVRINSLNRGIGFAAVSAALVEVLQGLIGNGHSFHTYELVVKLIVVLFGFMMGLDARFEGMLSCGTVRVRLPSPGKSQGVYSGHGRF